MTFRARLTLVAAAAVALAVIAASAVVYVVVRDQLRSQVDSGLRDRAGEISNESLNRIFFSPPSEIGGARYYIQLVGPDGSCTGQSDTPCLLHPGTGTVAVASEADHVVFSDVHVRGYHLRVLT